MSFNPYQNSGAGIAALGPVQAMSDRNDAQTYMANGGQMYASGGITALADGGALPKYKYDPVLQRYTLQDADAAATTAMEEELLRRQRAAAAGGGSSGSFTGESNYASPSGQTFGEALASAGINYGNVLGGMLPGAALARALGNAYVDNRLSNAAKLGGHTGTYTGYAAFGDRPNNTMTEAQTQAAIAGTGGGPLSGEAWGSGNYGMTGGVSGVGVGSSEGINSMDAQSDSYSSPSSESTSSESNSESGDGGGEHADGGLMALARGGGISHLGDYSDGGRLLRGPGDGVSDSIPAVIGNKRPARLADGEFVIPARIVSELGNGSTEAGARKLYDMMARIQQGRKKSIGKDRVAVNSRADKNLPA